MYHPGKGGFQQRSNHQGKHESASVSMNVLAAMSENKVP